MLELTSDPPDHCGACHRVLADSGPCGQYQAVRSIQKGVINIVNFGPCWHGRGNRRFQKIGGNINWPSNLLRQVNDVFLGLIDEPWVLNGKMNQGTGDTNRPSFGKNIFARHERTLRFKEPSQDVKYFSQAGQDLFALQISNFALGGIYMEIGGAHPLQANNTFLMEKDFLWTGSSVEINKDLVRVYNNVRYNQCDQYDATIYDYKSAFKLREFPKQINYLSVDTDPADVTYRSLLRCPFDSYRFSAITYEHDRYVAGDKFMNLSRKFLHSFGYQLVAANVNHSGRDFEDWWVDPNVVSEDTWRPFESVGLEFTEIILRSGLRSNFP